MKLLITGGAGFIGSNLARLALRSPEVDRVVVLDDFSTGRRANLRGLDVDLIEGSILDPRVLSQAIRGVDVVVHLAAIPSVPRSIEHPRPTHDANATGTLVVLEAARDNAVRHVSVASSSSVYGANTELPKRELSWTGPMSPYAVSKLATEAYTVAYAYSYGLSTTAFRFFNVYGPRQAADHAYAAVVPKFMQAIKTGAPLIIEGDGEQSRDFTFVDSVCEVLLASVLSPQPTMHPVNLAFGGRTTINELASMVIEISGATAARVEHSVTRVGDVRASQADSSSMDTMFSDVRPVPLSAGLAATWEWFQDPR